MISNNIQFLKIFIKIKLLNIGFIEAEKETLYDDNLNDVWSRLGMISLTGDKILEQTFASSTNYKSQSQYSDTISLENTSTDILINNIYQKLLIKLSENIIL